jgi:cholesterol transport system auxiliary component
MNCLSLLARAAAGGLVALCLAGCFGKPPPEQRYLRVAMDNVPCPGTASQQHRLPVGFKPLKTLENLDRTAVMTAQNQVLTASLQYYWEGAPQDVVGGILRQGLECQSTAITPVDYQPRVDHAAVLTGELTAFNVDYTDGGRFVVSLHLDLWTKNMATRVSSGDFNAYAPLADFKGETIARAASDALGRVVPKVVDWMDQGLPKLEKAIERK